MKALTYDEWKAAGYQVMKGEKSTGRNKKGQATFTREQVQEAEDLNDFICDPYTE